MSLSKRSAGTATASAILAATLALGLSATAAGVPTVPVKAATSATPSHSPAYDWSLTKSAEPSGTVTTSEDSATVTYTVVATRSTLGDENWSVTGRTRLRNTSKRPIKKVTVTISADGATCASDGSVGTLPPGARATVDYTCTYASNPGAGRHKVTTRINSSRGQRTLTKNFRFRAPANGSVDVSDSFNGGPYLPLEGGTALTDSRTFTYERTLTTPESSCHTYSNMVKLIGEAGDQKGTPTKGTAKKSTAKKGHSKNVKGSKGNTKASKSTNVKGSKGETKKGKGKGKKSARLLRTAGTAVTICRAAPLPIVSTQEIIPTGVEAAVNTAVTPRPTPRTKLRITKRGPKRARAGSLVRYRITVSTMGKVAARNVKVRDILPAGMVLAKRQRGLTQNGRTLTWTARGLSRKRSITKIVTLRVLTGAAGTRCNRADAVASNASRVRTRSCTRIVQPKPKPVSPAVTG